MIKLIATDLDGTLLDEQGEIPPETFDLVRKLHEEGVRYCVSSGRGYKMLTEMFAPVLDITDFVASNGNEVVVAGELIDFCGLSHSTVMRLAEAVNRFDAVHLIAVTPSGSWCLDDSEEKFSRTQGPRDPRFHQVRAIPPVDEPVYNGVIICDDAAECGDIVYALGLEMGSEITFAWAGGNGIDYFPRGVSKAVGLRTLMRHYGIERDEVMAYGDSMNDYDILRYVGHPVAMENAFLGVKTLAERIIEPNTEHGVQRDMARLLDQIHSGRIS